MRAYYVNDYKIVLCHKGYKLYFEYKRKSNELLICITNTRSNIVFSKTFDLDTEENTLFCQFKHFTISGAILNYDPKTPFTIMPIDVRAEDKHCIVKLAHTKYTKCCFQTIPRILRRKIKTITGGA